MTNIFILISLALNIIIIFLLLTRKSGGANVERTREIIERGNERVASTLRAEFSASRTESGETRKEIAQYMKNFSDSVNSRMLEMVNSQHGNFRGFSSKLEELIERNDQKMEKVKEAVERRLESIQKDNSEKLEKMRLTVDEKLHETLEKRLGDSFELVRKQLDSVHKDFGEVRALASGVGDLKKVFQNVKARGTWGEVQLENLLNQIFTSDQYSKNVSTKSGSRERVEFAIKIPIKDEKQRSIWLPIDAKFPLEDYENLIAAEEKGDLALMGTYVKALEQRIKSEARDIKSKYINPPDTTDYGVLYLPNEGIYAEVLRRPGLMDYLQRDCQVFVAGPYTIEAYLKSLQIALRTLAIERSATDVWNVLGKVKYEFGRFGDILDKTQKKLQEASNNIEEATSKSRTIERSLSKVQELPVAETVELIS